MYERRKFRYAIYCCVLVTSLQNVAPSLALPILDPGTRSEQQQRRCLTVHASPDINHSIPERIVKLLDLHQVEELVLTLPLKGGTGHITKVVSDGIATVGGGATSALCRSVWPNTAFPPEAVTELRAVYLIDRQSERGERHAVS